MFIVKAAFDQQIEIKTTLEKVKEFFSDTRNLVDILPDIESIRHLPAGIMNWTLGVNFPVIGSIRQDFVVQSATVSDELIEWVPARTEDSNLLRYSADLLAKSATETIIRLQHQVELRRNSASQLHSLAGFAGASFINRELQNRVSAALNNFLNEAKKRLEK